jgi:hypothetical protein
MSGEQAFPAETLSDWVSYAEQVSIVRITADRPIAPPTNLESTGGYRGREADFVVEQTLWTAPEITTPLTSFAMNVAGWFKDHEACIEGSPRVEVGDRYVIPIAHDDDGSVTTLSSSAFVALNQVRGLVGKYTDPAHDALRGTTVEQMTARLRAARMNPIAARYRNLSPRQRAMKVIEATQH